MRYLIVALVLSLLAALLYGLHTKSVRDALEYGKQQGIAACVSDYNEAVRTANEGRDRIEHQNVNLSSSDIDRRLSEWLRTE